jgi:hypothetical protein
MDSTVAPAASTIAKTMAAATMRLRRSAREPRYPVTVGTLPPKPARGTGSARRWIPSHPAARVAP